MADSVPSGLHCIKIMLRIKIKKSAEWLQIIRGWFSFIDSRMKIYAFHFPLSTFQTTSRNLFCIQMLNTKVLSLWGKKYIMLFWIASKSVILKHDWKCTIFIIIPPSLGLDLKCQSCCLSLSLTSNIVLPFLSWEPQLPRWWVNNGWLENSAAINHFNAASCDHTLT